MANIWEPLLRSGYHVRQRHISKPVAQSAGAVEYTDCTSAEG